MNSRLKKQAASLAALPPEERARLDRLAALAQSTPEEIWPSVQKYGFEDIEESVQAWLEAEEDAAAGRLIPHEQVMEEARQIVSQYGPRKQKLG